MQQFPDGALRVIPDQGMEVAPVEPDPWRAQRREPGESISVMHECTCQSENVDDLGEVRQSIDLDCAIGNARLAQPGQERGQLCPTAHEHCHVRLGVGCKHLTNKLAPMVGLCGSIAAE